MSDSELPAGRPLDFAVAEHVFGCSWYCHRSPDRGVGSVRVLAGPHWNLGIFRLCTPEEAATLPIQDDLKEVPAYSASRTLAALVEQHMFADGYSCTTQGSPTTKDGPWFASFAKGPATYRAGAQTVEVAIANAAVKAKRGSASV